MVEGRSSGGCANDCRDPTWGGDGTCNTSSDPPTCLCDERFASRDALGHATCVPRRVLVAGYGMLAAASFLTAAVVVWEASKFRHLPVGMAVSPRRTMTRLRALVFSSVFAFGFGCIGVALVALDGEASFYDDWFLQVEYCVLIPSIIFAVAMLADFWVEGLPSQLLPPGSWAEKLKKNSEEHNVFILFGGLNAGVISILGVLTVFFPVWPRLGADVAAIFGGLIACLAVLFVAIRMTLVINRFMKKAPETSKAFYFKAKRNIWVQTLSLCTVMGAEVALGVLKGMNAAGLNVSVILWYLQILAAQAGAALFALATNFHGPHPLARRPKVTNTNGITSKGLMNLEQRRAFVTGAGGVRFADMPLKHLVKVRIRRQETDSDEESDLSDETTHRSGVRSDGRPAPGQRQSRELGPAGRRLQFSSDKSAVRDGDALPTGMFSGLIHLANVEKGDQKRLGAINGGVSASLTPRSERRPLSGRRRQNLPPIVGTKRPEPVGGLVSAVGDGSTRGAYNDGVGVGGVRDDSVGRAKISEQRQEESDLVTKFTPRLSSPTASGWVSSVLKAVGDGGDAAETRKVVPIEQA